MIKVGEGENYKICEWMAVQLKGVLLRVGNFHPLKFLKHMRFKSDNHKVTGIYHKKHSQTEN